jgi:hypothetical protein
VYPLGARLLCCMPVPIICCSCILVWPANVAVEPHSPQQQQRGSSEPGITIKGGGGVIVIARVVAVRCALTVQ